MVVHHAHFFNLSGVNSNETFAFNLAEHLHLLEILNPAVNSDSANRFAHFKHLGVSFPQTQLVLLVDQVLDFV